MSWSTYTVGTPEEIKGRVEELKPSTPSGELSPQVEDQVKAAKTGALALIDSGAIGTGEAFSVTISGHANPEHKPAQGYANDCLTVAVAQVGASAVTQFNEQREAAERAAE